MAFESMDQAAEALAAAVNEPDGAPAPAAPVQETQPDANQPVVEPSTTEPQGQPQEPQQESLLASKDVDLSELSEEQRSYLQAREREMQAVMTQRTQEAAEARREAEEAVQFINELNTNPFFAQSVVQNLSQQLQAAGFSPAEANAQAQAQVSAQQGQPTPNTGFDDDGFEDDPYLAEINQLRQRQEQIDSMLAQQAEQNRVASLEAQLNNQAAYIQSQNADLTDSDMGKIINMAYAHGGNLVAAAEEYVAIREAAVQDWIARKGSATAPPAPVPTGGSAQPSPEKFESLHDPRLDQAAQARLNAVLGNS